jgi:hypothetical protein
LYEYKTYKEYYKSYDDGIAVEAEFATSQGIQRKRGRWVTNEVIRTDTSYATNKGYAWPKFISKTKKLIKQDEIADEWFRFFSPHVLSLSDFESNVGTDYNFPHYQALLEDVNLFHSYQSDLQIVKSEYLAENKKNTQSDLVNIPSRFVESFKSIWNNTFSIVMNVSIIIIIGIILLIFIYFIIKLLLKRRDKRRADLRNIFYEMQNSPLNPIASAPEINKN